MAQSGYLDLLNGSQTFIGVLLTLNVLCIFFDKGSNFIINLLDTQTKKFIDRLKQLEKGIEKAVDQFRTSQDYKDIPKIIAADSKYPLDVKREAQQLDYRTNVKILSYSVTVSESYPPIDAIKNYREQVLAPIFCLIYGIIIFMLDEIGKFFALPSELYVFSVFIFTILSCEYWIIIWVTFLVHSSKPHQADKSESWLQKMDDKIGVFFCGVIKMILSGGVFVVLLKYIPWTLVSIPFLKALLCLLAFLLPISVFGGLRIYNCNLKGYYSYMHVIGHVLSFEVYSVIAAILFNLINPFEAADLSFLVEVKWMRLTIVTFLMLNGLITPFLLPYIRYSQEYRKKKKEIKKTEAEIIDEIQSFSVGYSKICQRVGAAVIKGSGSRPSTD